MGRFSFWFYLSQVKNFKFFLHDIFSLNLLNFLNNFANLKKIIDRNAELSYFFFKFKNLFICNKQKH